MAFFDEIKPEPGFEVKGEPPDEDDIIPVHCCMYCHASTSQENLMTNVDLDEERLQTWADSLGVQLDFEYNKSNWMCKSHFKSTDFEQRGILRATAIPFRIRESNIVMKNQKKSPQKCVYCCLTKPFWSMKKIRANPIKFAQWKQRNDVRINDNDEAPLICKSHFKREDFTLGGDLKYNAILKLNKNSVNSESTSESQFIECVHCRCTKNVLYLVEVEKDINRLKQWNNVGISFDNSNTIWICKAHFQSWDFTKEGKLKRGAIPMNSMPVVDVRTCVYCKNTQASIEFSKIATDKEKFEVWNYTSGFNLKYSDVVENSWMCKSHFQFRNPRIFAKPVPIEKVPVPDVQTCVYCKTTRSSSEFSRIITNRSGFDVWNKANGFNLSYIEVVKNNWICKSHLMASNNPSESVHISYIDFQKDRFEVCVWCRSSRNYSYLAPVCFKPKYLWYWKRPDGSKVDFGDIARDPFICKSHFSPEFITKHGTLRLGSVPKDSLSFRPSFLPKKKCIYCGVKNDRSNLAKVMMSQENFEKWTESSGVDIDYSKFLQNPWICKSHMDSSHLEHAKVYDTKGVLKIDQVDGRIVLCIYCKLYKICSVMVVANMDAKRWKKWMNTDDLEGYEDTPFVCKSHFKSEDFTESGGLKKSAIPNSSMEQNGADDKEFRYVMLCVYCNLYKTCFDMVVASMDEKRWKKWMDTDDLEGYKENLFVCRSHFKSDDFTQVGSLKKSAIPLPVENVKLEEPDQDDQQVEDLLDAAIQIQPDEEEEVEEQKPVLSALHIPELQDHNYSKLGIDINL